MIFNEKDRLAKIYIEAKQISKLTPEQTFNAMIDLTQSVIKICLSSIKAKNPNISEEEMLKELNKICWSNRDENFQRNSKNLS